MILTEIRFTLVTIILLGYRNFNFRYIFHICRHPDDNNPYYLKVSSSSLFTFGHGVCKTIKFEEPIHSNYFVVFMTKVHVESIVFLLQDYYDQIFLSTMVVVHELPNFAISSSLGTSLSLKEVTYLNTLENPCKSESKKVIFESNR